MNRDNWRKVYLCLEELSDADIKGLAYGYMLEAGATQHQCDHFTSEWDTTSSRETRLLIMEREAERAHVDIVYEAGVNE